MKMKTKITSSQAWLRSFKYCHGIRVLRVSGEMHSADQNAVKNDCITFEDIDSKYSLSQDKVSNADETAFYWKYLPIKTLAGIEGRRANVPKINKNRL